jgi:hypothetical protein
MNMSVNIEGFRRAMKAAMDGPELKDVEWSSYGHDFNVKKVAVKKTDDGIEINGGDGHHISHRLRWRPDDQVHFQCRVTRDGKVEGLEVNVKTSWDTLKEWFETAGKIIGVAAMVAGKLDASGSLDPTPSSTEHLLDGSWKGDVEFLIANIITAVAIREMPDLGKVSVPDFSFMTAVVHPKILARFHEARGRLAQH